MKHSDSYLVFYDPDAVIDFEDVKSRGDRKATFNAVDKLRQLGPHLVPPHMKSLKGKNDLFELRPKQGGSPVRPIYIRVDDWYVIVAVAPTKGRFDSKLEEAARRAHRYDAGNAL